MRNKFWWTLPVLIWVLSGCEKDMPMVEPSPYTYDPTPYTLTKPVGLPAFPTSDFGNPLTNEGVDLGRKLFYDPILSADSTLSCAGCHHIEFAFTDSDKVFSLGIDGILGVRNSMPIFNLIYTGLDPAFGGFFWDGRALHLEDQALLPIQDPVEMHNTLEAAVAAVQAQERYQKDFYEAFCTTTVTSDLIARALAQFMRTVVSGNSKFDQAFNAVPGVFLTEQELEGWMLFNDNEGADCFHCHGINGGLFTDFLFRNNGLNDASTYTDFPDPGRGSVTGDTLDYGKFKTPSLRNIALTAPYMHDGRFATLDEVLEFYSTGVHDTPFTDPFMQKAYQGGVQLSDEEKEALKAFLMTLTDTSFANNPAWQNPFAE
ncbi:MAG: c-type cytochrome [Chitinophagales bacterium]|nr:c-type cytochrome [Chitinophagales bacterium]MCB9021161.1 c-type cytochrome [Chitinophagales bacterium]HPR27982.1 cytochrome c peroxidase [Chitinophagales bacterium]